MRARKTDANQKQIIDALEKIGASVQRIDGVGGGTPDLLVGYEGINVLLEIKTQDGKLNTLQKNWHATWQGEVSVVLDAEEAIEVVLKSALHF